MIRRALLAALLAMPCSSCGASSGAAVINAAINTPIAVGAAVARRTAGACYTWCDEFSRCDEKSGLCVPLPCGGRCRPTERCNKDFVPERCVPAIDQDRTGRAPSSAQPPAGVAAPAKPPWMP